MGTTALGADSPLGLIVAGGIALNMLLSLMFLVTRYRRCGPNEILVVYGSVGPQRVKCLHGAGTFVLPLVQGWAKLSLRPIPLQLELDGVPFSGGGRVSVRIRGNMAISTEPAMMRSAAERLLGLNAEQLTEMGRGTADTAAVGLVQRTEAGEAEHNRHAFKKAVRDAIDESLAALGLTTTGLEILDLTIQQPEAAALGTSASERTQ